MAGDQNRKKIILDQDSSAIVERSGISVAFDPDGDIVIHANGNRIYGLYDEVKRQIQIGRTMEDGTICAGISPDTHKLIYALPHDAPLQMIWNQAMSYAASYEAHSHPRGTFRLPTAGELNVLFNNRAAIGGFNLTGSYPAGGWYWAASERSGGSEAYNQRFDDGYRSYSRKSDLSSLRLIRD